MEKTEPSRNTIIHWDNLFMENRNLSHRGANSKPQASEVTVEQVRFMFENQNRQSIRAAVSTLQVSYTTMHRILRRCLFFVPIQGTKFPWPSQQRQS